MSETSVRKGTNRSGCSMRAGGLWAQGLPPQTGIPPAVIGRGRELRLWWGCMCVCMCVLGCALGEELGYDFQAPGLR